jgi:ABC-type sugar transport system permease subunit
VLGASTIGLAIALIMNSEFRCRNIVRSLLVIPWAIPWVVDGFLWAWILDANFGLLNGVLYQLGIIHSYMVFFSTDLALPLTALAAVWTQSSFTGLICLSGLQSIPQDMYDSASVDGADAARKFWHITFPWIRPTLGMSTLVNAMVGLTMFDLIFIMTSGGPGTATLLLPFLVFREFFIDLNIGVGAAFSLFLTVLVLCVSSVYMLLLYRRARFYK